MRNILTSLEPLSGYPRNREAMTAIFSTIKSERKKKELLEILDALDDKNFNEYKYLLE